MEMHGKVHLEFQLARRKMKSLTYYDPKLQTPLAALKQARDQTANTREGTSLLRQLSFKAQ